MTQNFQIEPVAAKDLVKLQSVAKDTFSDTFPNATRPENLAAYLSTAFSTERLAAELANPYSMFFFARRNTEILAYLKLNHGSAQTKPDYANALEIERLYVRRHAKGRGIGKILMLHALQVATKLKVDRVWLGVWEHNQDAIAFYEHFGFEAFSQHDFLIGQELQRDIVMRRSPSPLPHT